MNKMKKYKLLAVDLGASSGRVIQAMYSDHKLELEEVHRFKNEAINLNDGLYWNIMKIFQEIKVGIKKATQDGFPISAISVDTWGVDYGYLDKDGDLIYTPHCYRDHRMGKYEEAFYNQLSKEALFMETGVQPALINTVIQIYSDLQEKPFLKDIVKHVLFIPDLIHYFLSDTIANEYTIASTSGLMNIESKDWSSRIFDSLGIPKEWFEPVAINGRTLRSLSSRISQELQIEPFQVLAGASHDTAGAVLAVPYQDKEHSIFISSGTWSLVGKEHSTPALSKEAFEWGFTNEGCFNGNYRILKNTTGMWIIQELQREWELNGEKISFSEMVDLAETITDNQVFINPNDRSFADPLHMENKIVEYAKRTNQPVPQSKAEVLRTVYESLAFSYRQTVEELEQLTDHKIETIHMVGGGIQNQLLCQLTANMTGKRVVAGPIEASALGNVIAQLLTLGIISEEEILPIINRSEGTTIYEPESNDAREALFSKYKNVLKAE